MKIDLAPKGEKVFAYSESKKIIKVLKKFGRQIKKLEIVNVPLFHLAEFKDFLISTPLVESLTLSFSPKAVLPDFELRMTSLEEFRHLKKVSFKNTPGVASILDMIPLDTLEELEIDALSESAMDGDKFQRILACQNKIKKIKLELQNVCLIHLTLDAYELDRKRGADSLKLIETLIYQDLLREFKTNVMISTTIFVQLSDMINLVTLHVPIDIVKPGDFAKIRKLVNLKDLAITETNHEMWVIGDFVEMVDERNVNQIVRTDMPKISDIVLPKLETLLLNLPFRLLSSADYLALSQNLENLKDLSVTSTDIADLEFAIGNVPNLKTLQVFFEGVFSGNSRISGNDSLEELRIVGIPFYCWSMKRIFDNVNACPNLKRLALKVIQLDEQLEILLRSLPKLTHVYLELPDPAVVQFFNEVNAGYTLLDGDCSLQALKQTMNLFKKSPDFKRLSFKFLDTGFVRDLQEFADNNRSEIKLVIHDGFVELVKGGTDGDIHKHFSRDIHTKLSETRSQYVLFNS